MTFPLSVIIPFGIWTLGASVVIDNDDDTEKAFKKTNSKIVLENDKIINVIEKFPTHYEPRYKPLLEYEAADLITKESCVILKSFSKIIEKSPNNAESFEIFINNWLSEQELKMKDFGIPLRIALTGSKSAPSIFALIQSLGFEEVKLRINQICI